MKILGDEIHVWQSDLVVSADRLQSLADTLSREERSRASRIAAAPGRERFITARGLLRELLGRYLDTPPDRVALRYEERGKPCLSASTPLHFNVSHADERALFAFTPVGPVGVDLERLRVLPHAQRIARRAFTRPDLESWLALPQEQQMLGFFERWTRMEAFAKLNGHGVWRLLAEGAERSDDAVEFHSLDVPDGLLATLAMRRCDGPIRVVHLPS